MDLWIIMLIIANSILLVLLILLLTILIKKKKRQKILKITNDINQVVTTLKLKILKPKELPVSVEKITDEIYYNDKVILGQYETNKTITGQNICLDIIDKGFSKKIYFRYKIRDVNFIKSSNFIPLNQIDLLVSKHNMYFIDPFDPQVIALTNINNITFFWEKNRFIKNKQKFMGIELNSQNQHFLLLFNNYDNAINLVAHWLLLTK